MELDQLWSEVVYLVRRLEQTKFGPPLQGQFTVETIEDQRVLEDCIAHKQETHIEIEQESKPQIGEKLEVTISPRFGFGILSKDFDGLLNAQSARIAAPQRFFLLDSGTNGNDPVDDQSIVGRYRVALRFLASLKPVAAFLDPDEQTLVFIDGGRFDVPVKYCGEDLKQMNVANVAEACALIPTDLHQNQCKAILGAAIVELTRRVSPDKRFRHLLASAAELIDHYKDGYRLFASQFSYEKVRDQVESARVEYTGKIHKVFADVQNQLLGIPVATIIVATQMKHDATTIGYEFWVNVAVLFGCWVFAVFMVLVLRNQGHVLDVLEAEISRQRCQLENEFATVAPRFTDTFTFLSGRAAAQRCVIYVVAVSVVVGLVLSHVIFFRFTPPAWLWLCRAFGFGGIASGFSGPS